MSNQVKSAEEAVTRLYRDVHTPVFFKKLASYGISPRNDAEAQRLLDIGATLFNAYQQESIKQATVENDFLKCAYESLCGPQDQQAAEANWVKSAAAEFVSYDPALLEAAYIAQDAILKSMHGA